MRQGGRVGNAARGGTIDLMHLVSGEPPTLVDQVRILSLCFACSGRLSMCFVFLDLRQSEVPGATRSRRLGLMRLS